MRLVDVFTQGIERSLSETSFTPPKLMFCNVCTVSHKFLLLVFIETWSFALFRPVYSFGRAKVRELKSLPKAFSHQLGQKYLEIEMDEVF